MASERELIAAIEEWLWLAMAVISLAGHRSLQHFIHPATQQRLSGRTLIHMGSDQFWLQGQHVCFLLQSTVLINFQSPDTTEFMGWSPVSSYNNILVSRNKMVDSLKFGKKKKKVKINLPIKLCKCERKLNI